MLVIERIPQGIRIRDLERLKEAQERARRAASRIMAHAPTVKVVPLAFTAWEEAWFRRPLSRSGDDICSGL